MDNEDYKRKYDQLADRVRTMLAAQKSYFTSNKDYQLLKVSKALEKEVDDLVNPKVKPVSQGQIDWLAQ